MSFLEIYIKQDGMWILCKILLEKIFIWVLFGMSHRPVCFCDATANYNVFLKASTENIILISLKFFEMFENPH